MFMFQTTSSPGNKTQQQWICSSTTQLHNQRSELQPSPRGCQSGLLDGEDETVIQRQQAEAAAVLVHTACLPCYLVQTARERGYVQQAVREPLPAASHSETRERRHHACHLRKMETLLVTGPPQVAVLNVPQQLG